MASSPVDSSRYFIRLRGQVKGPFTLEQLTRMAGRGQFSRLHQVSVDQARWTPAAELKTIFAEKTGTTGAEPAAAAPLAPAAPKEWYYNSGDSKIGPVDEAFIKNLIVTGKIHGKTLLWKTGLPDWLEAKHFFPNAFGKPGWSRGKTAVVMNALLLFVVASIWGGYFAYTRWGGAGTTTPVEPAAHAPKPSAPPAVAASGLIQSTDLSDPAVNAAIDDATGMIVSYLDIDMATGEHHELGRGHGTCFVVTLDGYALTNKHVIEEHEKFDNATDNGRIKRLTSTLKTSYGFKRSADGEPILKDGQPEPNLFVTGLLEAFESRVAQIEPKLVVYFGKRHYPAKLVYASSRFDMAVVKIDRPSQTSVFALSSRSETPKLTEVVAFGFPGVSQKPITDEEIAIVEAKAKKESLSELFFGTKDHRDAYKASAFDLTPTPGQISIIPQESGGIYHAQHTAVIRPGNSGGPLVFRHGDAAGVVYGINTLFLRNDAPVFVAFPVAQMREELETEANISGLTWH